MHDLFGPEPVTIWDIARHWLGRPMLTKLLKEHGKAAVKAATLKALEDEAVEQTPYLIAILQEGDGGATPPWQFSDHALIAESKARNLPTRGKSRQELINALR